MEEQREWTIGAHALRFEPPDILWVEFRGEISLEDTKALVDCYRELSRSGPYFLVGDLRNAPLIGAEPRRYLSEHAETSWVLGNIFIGASLAQKAAAKGIFLAAFLIGRADKSEESKVHFASTPAEASALVARLRARHGGQGT